MPLDEQELRRRKKQIEDEDGPWLAHEIALPFGISTAEGKTGAHRRVRVIRRLAADLVKKRTKDLRVLDLGSNEGMFCIDFARRGASAVGIEGREVSHRKARFAQDALELDRLKLICGDVRAIDPSLGRFDVILCLGLLNHQDGPNVLGLARSIAQVCDGIAIFETHVSLTGARRVVIEGEEYEGSDYAEHPVNASDADKAQRLWASLDNPKSFWPTRASLRRILLRAGFTSLLEVQSGALGDFPFGRVMWVCTVGTQDTELDAPSVSEHEGMVRARHAAKIFALEILSEPWAQPVVKVARRLGFGRGKRKPG